MKWKDGSDKAVKGETVLVPACFDEMTLEGDAKLLEIFID